MRLALATPFVAQSSVGRGSLLIAHELARRGHQLTIVASEHDIVPPAAQHPHDFPVVHWSALDLVEARDAFDLAVVNVGNYTDYHRAIFPILAAIPSVGLFHDFYAYNLFADWAAGRGLSIAEQDRIAGAFCGSVKFARQAREHRIAEAAIAERLPMTEWIAAQCIGAIAHADFYRSRLAAACPGPVAIAPLAWPTRDVEPPAEVEPERLTLSIIGIQNANKCAGVVIRAIAASPLLRRRLRLELVGEIAPSAQEGLSKLAGRAVEVRFTGLVDDAGYDAALCGADIVCCLRRPMVEGASATAIEGLRSGRPVLVADAGFYAELPDGAAIKLAPDFRAATVRRALERLVEDRALRLAVGGRGAAWAKARFTVEAYVDVLDRLLIEAAALAPLARVRSRLVSQLAEMGVPPEMADGLDAPRALATLAEGAGEAGQRLAKANAEVFPTLLRSLAIPWSSRPHVRVFEGPPRLRGLAEGLSDRSPVWARPALRLAWRAGKRAYRLMARAPQSAQ